ncbi:MAG TPA: serine/threonine-protein kinase [Anaerolineales bacterium]|nr:serine/threonine-protein kinase [Anaerolineales bacterium]
MEDLTGKQFGQYQIVAPLGEGGMAAVYKAYQPAMERYVAIKVLPRHMSSSEEFILRFRREAKMLAQLQHVYILPVFDYGEEDGYPYIVMPFVPSGTLADVLKNNRLSLSEVRRILTQIGDALGYAHARGMIHRDIKPSNILVDDRDNCLLTDFGLARMTEEPARLTSSGAVMGTPAYMSPEQGTGSTIDQRSDIYSLGIILFEMLTGRVPYMAETPIAVVFKHLQDPLPSVRKYNSNLPEAVELVLFKALAKSPEARYQTAQDFIEALQKAIPADTSLENRNSTQQYTASVPTAPPDKSQAHNKWIVPAGILGVISLLAVAAFWTISQRNSQIPPTQPSLTSTVLAAAILTTPTAVEIETQTPAITSVPTATISPPDQLSNYLNDVKVIDSNTFDNSPESRWNVYAGRIENGVMELIGNENWNGAARNREFGENEGIIIDFNYSTNSLYEIFIENGVWATDQYRRFGLYIGSNQAQVNEYEGNSDHGGANLSGNLSLRQGTTYSLLIAILPNGELLEVIWDPSNSSDTRIYRETFDETWAGLTWTFWIGVNQGTIQFDNFKEIRFSGAK